MSYATLDFYVIQCANAWQLRKRRKSTRISEKGEAVVYGPCQTINKAFPRWFKMEKLFHLLYLAHSQQTHLESFLFQMFLMLHALSDVTNVGHLALLVDSGYKP